MHLDLYRRWYEPERTIGELYLSTGDFLCFTMEPGWNDSQAPHVDAGEYDLVRHDHPGYKIKDTWALVGKGVSHQPQAGVPRSAILIHAGNVDQDSLGCILVGLTIGRLGDEVALLKSREAMSALRAVLGDGNASLTIWDD